MDNIEETKTQDSVEKETQPSSSPSASDPSALSLPIDSLPKQEDSHPSPGQEDQEIIDITTIKAEDAPIAISEELEKTPTDLDKTQDSLLINKNIINVPGMLIEQQPPSDTVKEETPQASSSSIPINTTTTNFEEIQNQLKKTLDHIEQRNMVSGFRTLSNATSAVVDHCEQLGLTSDDHPYNAIDREQFWAGLNNCWLYALAQRHEPSSNDERMTDEQLCKLRERVVTWADKLERFGLVDYEMGWWEADILAAMDAILATNFASAQAAAQAAMAKAAAAIFGNEAV